MHAWKVFIEALRRGSAMTRRARFAMSHETGKIEIPAGDDEHIYIRNHRAKGSKLRGQFMIYKRDDKACCLDEPELEESCGAPECSPSSRFNVSDGRG